MIRLTEGDDGWTFDVFEPDEDHAALETFASLLDLWREKRAGRRFPAWRDFDILEFAGWWGWLYVRDVLATDSMKLRYRLWGTHVAELYGIDVTGQVVEEGVPSDAADRLLVVAPDYQFFKHMLEHGRIGVMSGEKYWQDREHIWSATLCLPLADDGEHPDKLMSAVSRPDLSWHAGPEL